MPSHAPCTQVRSLQCRCKIINAPISLALTIRLLYEKYSELNALLCRSSNNTVNRNQYLRVLIIATIGSVCLVPLGIYNLILNLGYAYAWPGWKKIHSEFSVISLVPNSIWRSDHVLKHNLELIRWEFVFNAFVIFACFGVHQEARNGYLSAARFVSQRFSFLQVKRFFV